MLRTSSFIAERSRAFSAKEERYYAIFSAVLFLCGALFLIIPVFSINGILLLAESWVLVVVLAMSVLRPLFYSRGVADVVMAIFTGTLYAYVCFAIGSDTLSLERFRLGLCAALFLSGISRIMAYARMIVVVNIPLMPLCGLAEMISSVLIFAGFPSESVYMMYWLLGMTTLLNAGENVSEYAKLIEISKEYWKKNF